MLTKQLQEVTIGFMMCLSVCASVHTEQLGSNRTGFMKLYQAILLQAVQKIQILSKLDTNNSNCT